MAEAWAGIAKTTIENHIRDVEPTILRRRIIPAMLETMGRIKTNLSGTKLTWRVGKKRVGLTPYDDMMAVAFQRINRHEVPELDYRGYVSSEAYSELDRLRNRGSEAIVKKISEIAEVLLEDVVENFHEEMFKDGNAAGNESRFHGLESWFSTTGVASVGENRILVNNDNYAGLDSTLGAFGGTWEDDGSGNTVWPEGTGDVEFDFWTPPVIDYNSAGFSSTATWKANSIAAMRYALYACMRNTGSLRDIAFILDGSMHREFKDEMQLKERIIVNRNAEQSNLVALGFASLDFDGYEVTWEYGVPRSTTAQDNRVGYLLNFAKLELCSLYPQVFQPHGPEWSIERLAYQILIAIFGNFRTTSPRYHAKLTTIN